MESTADTQRPHIHDTTWRAEVRRGFLAIVPLWPGGIAFGIAFALIARDSGFSGVETQALSMLVYAGSAQLAAVTMFGDGAGALAILLTVLVLNLRHVLYALSLDRLLPRPSRLPRPLLAFFLTDETYGFTIRRAAERAERQRPSIEPYYVGTSLSLYSEFAIATLFGLLFGSLLPDPERIALSFIFPLTFLALLIPLLKARRGVLVASVAGATALALSSIAGSGETILGATIVAATLGAVLDLRAGEGT